MVTNTKLELLDFVIVGNTEGHRRPFYKLYNRGKTRKNCVIS
jgi:hypothetical protein